MGACPSLIAELEEAIPTGVKDRRVDALRRITDLFVADADRFNDQQIEVFDDVLGHLIKRIEDKALAELSRRLGPLRNAPTEVVRCLARNDDIAVAEPILKQSQRLSDADLIEIASTKTQAHLLAISARPEIGTKVTDVLVQFGDRPVIHKLAENAGARFSDAGFATLVKHAQNDEHLAERVGLRLDVPLRLFRELLARATQAVRSRLLALAGPESRAQIQRVLQAIAEDTEQEDGFRREADFADALERVVAMRAGGRLNEAAVSEFAKADRHADMVAALALLCGVPLQMVDRLLQNDKREAVLVPCRAAGLDWLTVRAVLTCRSMARRDSDHDLEAARTDYIRLSQAGAQRVLRFWQVRESATKDDVVAHRLRPVASDYDNLPKQ